MARNWKALSKHVDVADDGVIRVKRVILSFPHLFEPRTGKNDDGTVKKPRYDAKFLLPKESHQADAKALNGHFSTLMKEKWKRDLSPVARCLKTHQFLNKTYEGDENYFHLSAGELVQPELRDASGKRKLREEDDELYAGAIVTVLIRPWCQDNKHGQKLNANLIAVQKIADGERIGSGRPKADDDDFESVADEFEGENLDASDLDEGFGEEDDGFGDD
jgi:hypothetical protein